VRCLGKAKHHDLYRTTDGATFTKIASPKLDPFPMQITDVFRVKGTLMCLWFATDYSRTGRGSWGVLTSTDDGAHWTQRVVEKDVPLADLPTEPSVVVMDDGRLLGLARTEIPGEEGGRQFQLTSCDGGMTWRKTKTNIGDVRISTPALVYDAATGVVHNYYYERGKGRVKRRTAKASEIFDNPTRWPAPTVVAYGHEERPHDAGNVNVAVWNGKHVLAYYYGTQSQAAVYVKSLRPCVTATPLADLERPSATAHFVAEHPWKCFYYTNSLEAAAGAVKAYADTLTLPTGETLKAKELTFDAENRGDLDKLFGVKHRENHWDMDAQDNHYAILVNELYAPADGTAMIGATAEWWMSFYANGEKVYTTWPNGDYWDSIQYTNHVFPVPLKKGRNLVVLYARRGLGRWFAAFGEAPKMPSVWSRQTVERHFFPGTEQIDCGPWLTDPAADSATISFILPRTRRAGIEYRKVGVEAWTKVWQQSAIQKRTGAFFRYELKGLEPDAQYEYRVVTIVGTKTVRSPLHHFRTFSAKPQTVRLTVTADLHLDAPDAADDRFVPMSKMPNALDADVFVSLGDSTSRGEDIRRGMIDYYMKGLLRTFGHDRYVFTVHGNHEWRGEDASEYFMYFPKGYYSARVGEAFLLVLDSGERDPIDSWQGKADPDAAYNVYDKAYMAEQRKWLEETLKSESCRSAKFRIVMIHCPPTVTLPYETPHMKALLDGLLVSWDKNKKPEVLTHLWLTGHKHESWFRQRMGINELQICGPHHVGGGLGCATVEIGPEAIRLKDWHVRRNELAYDVTITPDGKVIQKSGK